MKMVAAKDKRRMETKDRVFCNPITKYEDNEVTIKKKKKEKGNYKYAYKITEKKKK